jgi:hypothetical protein
LSGRAASGIATRVTPLTPPPPAARGSARAAARPPLAAALLSLLAATACVPGAPPPAAPPPRPVPLPTVAAPAPAAADWQDWLWTPGTWSYARDPRGSRALYGPPASDALVVLRCDLSTRAIYLSRAGSVTAPFTVRTTTVTRQLATQPTGGALPYVAAALVATDPLLDAIAFSRGRFTIEQPGTTPLVLPPWGEVGRVIEDCRG